MNCSYEGDLAKVAGECICDALFASWLERDPT